MSIGDFENARKVPAEDLAALLLSKSCHHLVPVAGEGNVLVRPADKNVLVLQAEVGDWRLRPGDYAGFDFVDGDVTVANDTVDETGHGYETGDGPFQLTNSGGALPTGLSAGQDYFIIAVDDDTIAFADSVAEAQADTRVTITAAAGGGTHTMGGPAGFAPAATPAASTDEGYGSALLGEGATLVCTAPSVLTVVGFGAAPVLTYWWI